MAICQKRAQSIWRLCPKFDLYKQPRNPRRTTDGVQIPKRLPRTGEVVPLLSYRLVYLRVHSSHLNQQFVNHVVNHCVALKTLWIDDFRMRRACTEMVAACLGRRPLQTLKLTVGDFDIRRSASYRRGSQTYQQR
jgi:hypothetical protein